MPARRWRFSPSIRSSAGWLHKCGISSGIQDSVTELRGTNEGIQKFNDKDFSQKQPVIITGNGNTTNNIVSESDKGRPKKAKEKRTPFIDDNYNVAKTFYTVDVG